MHIPGFSKAFDKVETGVLLHKLKNFEIQGKVGCWLAAFLDSNTRQQAVAVEGRISDLSPVISGVPQGTVLGPVLFLIHISDIARGVSQSAETTSFADDTRVKRPIKDEPNDCQSLQQDLQSIYDWAEDVNMHFNSDKFECIRYWPGRDIPQYPYKSPEGDDIEEKVHIKDLGIHLSNNLNFQFHIQKVVTSGSKLVG